MKPFFSFLFLLMLGITTSCGDDSPETEEVRTGENTYYVPNKGLHLDQVKTSRYNIQYFYDDQDLLDSIRYESKKLGTITYKYNFNTNEIIMVQVLPNSVTVRLDTIVPTYSPAGCISSLVRRSTRPWGEDSNISIKEKVTATYDVDCRLNKLNVSNKKLAINTEGERLYDADMSTDCEFFWADHKLDSIAASEKWHELYYRTESEYKATFFHAFTYLENPPTDYINKYEMHISSTVYFLTELDLDYLLVFAYAGLFGKGPQQFFDRYSMRYSLFAVDTTDKLLQGHSERANETYQFDSDGKIITNSFSDTHYFY